MSRATIMNMWWLGMGGGPVRRLPGNRLMLLQDVKMTSGHGNKGHRGCGHSPRRELLECWINKSLKKMTRPGGCG